MANSHYTPDSGHFIPSSPMVQVRSDMTASGLRTLVRERANTTDGPSSPAITTPTIG
jgi:hypothetical protein